MISRMMQPTITARLMIRIAAVGALRFFCAGAVGAGAVGAGARLRLCFRYRGYALAGLSRFTTPGEISAAIYACLRCGQVARPTEGAVDIRPSLCHADQGFVFDEVEALFIDLQEFDIFWLRRTAAGAAFDRARVLGVAECALPNQGDKSEGLASHASSMGRLR
jgi:hypothetical protein